MRDLSGEADFGVKARQAIGVSGNGFEEELQRHGLSQFEIVLAVDRTHATAAEQS
jgi:hypothetical protein